VDPGSVLTVENPNGSGTPPLPPPPLSRETPVVVPVNNGFDMEVLP
jgi:hypothetical protein